MARRWDNLPTWAPWWLRRRLQRPGVRQYTQAEIEQADCFRCGCPAHHQWQVCADANTWRPLCLACDLALNQLVLEWMHHQDAVRLVQDYRKEQERHGA